MKDLSVSSRKVGAHAPEPWGVSLGTSHVWIHDSDTNTVFALNRENDRACEANARRIVACVNACAGVSTAALEDGCQPALAGTRMQRQRDELAEALRKIESSGVCNCRAIAHAALAKP